jgi:hypothetical protein
MAHVDSRRGQPGLTALELCLPIWAHQEVIGHEHCSSRSGDDAS